jgi:hypothetical protein
MLPFRVIQIERHRALERNATGLLPTNPFRLAAPPSGRATTRSFGTGTAEVLSEEKTMTANKSLIAFAPWGFASICIFVLAYIDHIRSVQLIAFAALSISIFFFAMSHRSFHAGHQPSIRYGARISAWATILAGILYLVLSQWWH